MNILKRSLTLLLALVLVLAIVPFAALAEEDAAAEETSVTEPVPEEPAEETPSTEEESDEASENTPEEADLDADVTDDPSIGTGTPDGTPPALISISLSKTTVQAPGQIEVTAEASDDVSGPDRGWIYFYCETTKKTLNVHVESTYWDQNAYQWVPYADGKLHGTLDIDQYVENGTFLINDVEIYDVANNSHYYSRYAEDSGDNYGPLPDAVRELQFSVTDPVSADSTPPTLVNIVLSKTTVQAPGQIEVTVDASDDVSGPDHGWVYFYCETTKKTLNVHVESTYWDQNTRQETVYADGKLHGTLDIDQYVENGTFLINDVEIYDVANNSHYYSRYAEDSGRSYGPLPEAVREVQFSVLQSSTPDSNPPVLKSIALSSANVTAPGRLEVTVDAADDVSGPDHGWVYFFCESTKKTLNVHVESTYWDQNTHQEVAYADGKLHGTLVIDQYVENGTFFVSDVEIYDTANNSYYYNRYANGTHHDYGPLPEAVKGLQLTIRNTGADLSTSISKPTFVQEVESAANDAYIVADYSGNATLTEEVFDAIAGTDKTLDLSSDGITWRFNGQDITEEIKPVDLHVDILPVEQDKSEEGGEIQDNLNENPGVVMKFPENGTLPGKATIQIKVDHTMREYLGRSKGLCVYYYNNQTGEMEMIADNLVVVDESYIEFTITHCSDYVLTHDPSIVQNRLLLTGVDGGDIVFVDGNAYTVSEDENSAYIDLPDNASHMVTYSWHTGDEGDIHTKYPTGMQVFRLSKSDYGTYSAIHVVELDDILQYSGSSIRIVGVKGIRMITSMDQGKKAALTSEAGLGGYKLLEYGTVLALSSNLEGGKPLVLGPDYAKSNYAYKRGVADPVFAYSGNLVQYTNVLVGFNMEQCKEDIAMRPYIILEDPDGSVVTLYGGIVYRSIGYIAWQNRNVFQPTDPAYDYVWDIIHNVYGDKYDEEYKGKSA